VKKKGAKNSSMDSEDAQEGDLELRYYISSSKNKAIDVSVLVRNRAEDPAYKV
jgi:hypothetical protein